ncbi:uncharacterized protein LOC117156093 [Bombus vancouverensis nearcticus]|uniref:Uncharacterized protein LOC117214187 n=1 Tax=Bombus bifarius TaxID=103933 RepID=A0A6P8MQ72_9HYME|nr:uncharacterized protein LOC117156093 [Bombus vancouverensis nearcticus]XP_033315956.1 uncharacterized protein LOC117214187 [Bombus bifarius]
MKVTKKIIQRQQEKEQALYVRLPHTIRDKDDVAKLFTGNFKVNLLRQSSRHCYVVFPDVKEKMKNLTAVKNTRINGKRIVIAPANTKIERKTTVVRKKIVIPKVKEDKKLTKHLFVSNIKCGTKSDELKAVIPGCVSVKMLKPYSQTSKAAIVKMESTQLAAEYLMNVRDMPTVAGRKLRLNPDTRDRHRRHESKPLKIYDGESEI